jgi:hypothetical protein
MAVGADVSEEQQAIADQIWGSMQAGGYSYYYSRQGPAYVLDGWNDGERDWLLEARPSETGTEVYPIAGRGGFGDSATFAPRREAPIQGTTVGFVTEDAAPVEYHRSGIPTPLVAKLLDLPSSFASDVDAYVIEEQPEGGPSEVLAYGADGTVLGSNLPPQQNGVRRLAAVASRRRGSSRSQPPRTATGPPPALSPWARARHSVHASGDGGAACSSRPSTDPIRPCSSRRVLAPSWMDRLQADDGGIPRRDAPESTAVCGRGRPRRIGLGAVRTRWDGRPTKADEEAWSGPTPAKWSAAGPSRRRAALEAEDRDSTRRRRSDPGAGIQRPICSLV